MDVSIDDEFRSHLLSFISGLMVMLRRLVVHDDEFPRVRPVNQMCTDDGQADHLLVAVVIVVELLVEQHQAVQGGNGDALHALLVLATRMTVHRQEIRQRLTQRQIVRRVRVEVGHHELSEQVVVRQDAAEHKLADGRARGRLHLGGLVRGGRGGFESLREDLDERFALLGPSAVVEHAAAVRRQNVAQDVKGGYLKGVVAFIEAV